MKTLFFALLFTLALPLAVYASDEIRVTIDGTPVTFAQQAPVIVENRTLVPVRGVFEQLDFVVTWNDATRAATLTRSDYTIVITIGSNIFTTNGTRHTLDVPAQIINDSTMLPLRAVLESIGYRLDWVAATRTVLILTEDSLVGSRFVVEGGYGTMLTFGNGTFALTLDVSDIDLGGIDMNLPTALSGDFTINGNFRVNENAQTVSLGIERREAVRVVNEAITMLRDFTRDVDLDALSQDDAMAAGMMMIALMMLNDAMVDELIDEFMVMFRDFTLRYEGNFNRLYDDFEDVVFVRQ